MDKDLIIKLNNIGFDFKRDTLGKNVSIIIKESCKYFCSYYCRYNAVCDTVPDDEMPWCPLDELR